MGRRGRWQLCSVRAIALLSVDPTEVSQSRWSEWSHLRLCWLLIISIGFGIVAGYSASHLTCPLYQVQQYTVVLSGKTATLKLGGLLEYCSDEISVCYT